MAEGGTKQVLLAEPGTPLRKRFGGGIGIAAVLLVFGIGFGIWWTLIQTSSVKSSDQSQSAPSRTIVPMESFTVNLADPEDGRFLRTTLALGVAGQLPQLAKGAAKGVETSDVSIATIRDSIITVLAQCKSDQLLTSEGKLKLKADLITALNRDVPALNVQEIYFTDFLVQR